MQLNGQQIYITSTGDIILMESQGIPSLKKYDTFTEDDIAASVASNYQLVTRYETGENSKQINFQSEESGFYLAFVPEFTAHQECLIVSRIIVFYNVCPEENEELVMRPETIAPIVERISIPFEVTAECVAGASPDNGDAVRLNCNQGGTWTTIPGSGCSCNSVYKTSADGRSCTGILLFQLERPGTWMHEHIAGLCVAGQYYSVLNEECRDCPENSEGMESGLIECPCVEGYYRASGEEDLPCTREIYNYRPI